MSDSAKKWEELCEFNKDCKNVKTFLNSSIGNEEFKFNRTDENLLNEYKIEKNLKKEVGTKYSQHKAPIGSMLNQFNLALEAVALRSKEGHEGKYKEVDQDWMNFKRVPNAIEQYTNGTGRHLMYLGEDEDKLGHEVATAWNALARLQLILEQLNND